jgi:hypothetical protein
MTLVVDRIEAGWAVCRPSGDEGVQIEIPLRYLPPGVHEGDYMKVEFEIDRESTEQERKKAEGLLKELTRHQDPGRKKFKL